MKRALFATSLIGAIAMSSAAEASTWDEIMAKVVLPCVAYEVAELDLGERDVEAAGTILFEMDREYYENVADAVETALREHPNDNREWIFEAGLAACIQNQDSWEEEEEDRDDCDFDSDVLGCD